MIRPLLVLLGLSILLGGCARQPLQPIDSWEEHRAQIAALQNWQISGKLGAKLPEDNGSARLRWQQAPEAYRIDLSGPFGQGRMIITGEPGLVRLRQSGEPPLEAASAEELIRQSTGWRLPVEQLLYWVRGIPAPDSRPRRMEKTPQGLLAELEQNGWQLSYSDYRLVNERWRLPERIVARHRDIRLTLVIYQWTIGQAVNSTSAVE